MPVGHTCTHSCKHAVAEFCSARVDSLLPTPRGVRAPVVRDDQRVRSNIALWKRAWTHVDADLFAQPARIAVGGEAVEQDPEQ
jgi:hypothetical protein